MAERCLLDSRSEAAVFFAEKAFLESADNAETHILYARALFANKDYRRLVAKFRDTLAKEVRDLVARALLELDEKEQLEDLANAGGSSLSSSLHFALGRAAQKRQNIESAREHFRQALLKEELNYEAAASLFGTGLLTDKEEAEFPSILASFFSVNKQPVEVNPSLQNSSEFRVIEAKRKFQMGDFQGSLQAVVPLFSNGDCFLPAVEVFAGSLLALGETSELYFFAHRAMRQFPDDGRSWFAAGLYYMAANKAEQARKFLSRAFALDPHSLGICLAYGHAFSASEEAEQALSVYRTGHRLFPGSPLPLLYLARECIRTNNVPLAEKYLMSGMEVASSAVEQADLLSELGVCAHLAKNYAKACELFARAVDGLEKVNKPIPSSIWSNWGFALLKKREIAEAESAFRNAITADYKNADASLGLAFAKHLEEDFFAAVEHYGSALKVGPPKTLAVAKMLMTSAMAECVGHRIEFTNESNPRAVPPPPNQLVR